MKLYLLRGDTQQRIPIGEVSSPEEATALVAELDEMYKEWEKEGFPPHPFPPVLTSWEGCDVYLDDGKGNVWMTTYFGWQEVMEARSG